MNVIENILKRLDKLEREHERKEAQEHYHPIINLGAYTELTIAAGVITRTQSYHTVDTQADAASDDLDTINGGKDGDLLIICAANSARTVVAKDATGNLALAGDFTMDNGNDTLMLIYDGISTNWLEVSRSDNSA